MGVALSDNTTFYIAAESFYFVKNSDLK